MSWDGSDPAERYELDAIDLLVADLLGEYIDRREHHQPPCALDLLARAAEFSDQARHGLLTVMAFYEAMRRRRAERR